jgi:hypothetical protein
VTVPSASWRYYWSVQAVDAALAGSPFAAEEHFVPTIRVIRPDGAGDFPNIQAGIDAAAVADTIELVDGVFTGDGNRDLDFGGTGLEVRSGSGVAGACVIDCGGSASGLQIFPKRKSWIAIVLKSVSPSFAKKTKIRTTKRMHAKPFRRMVFSMIASRNFLKRLTPYQIFQGQVCFAFPDLSLIILLLT